MNTQVLLGDKISFKNYLEQRFFTDRKIIDRLDLIADIWLIVAESFTNI